MRKALFAVLLIAVFLTGSTARGAETIQRFPPPDFTETNHQIPEHILSSLQNPSERSVLDTLVLLATMAATIYMVFYGRTRKGVTAVSLACLLYFGFWREGCVCPVGSIQNITLGLFDPSYAVPWVVVAFFAIPLVASLFYGRVFCGGVCPLGTIQDVVLWRPVKVPRWLGEPLGILPFVYLGAAVLFAATNSIFIICSYDPFVPIFRLAGPLHMFLVGGGFLLLGMFVGRPYCRFLCPYGALLNITARVSMKRVTTTPDECVVCGLCDDSCPFDCILRPTDEKEAEL